MNKIDLVFEFLKPALSGLSSQQEQHTLGSLVNAAFEIAELTADEFIKRYGDEISGNDPDDQSESPDS
jgi:hypothetical protein